MSKRILRCLHCGHENPFLGTFCLECGARLQYSEQLDRSEPESENEPPPEQNQEFDKEPTFPPESKPQEDSPGRPVIADLEGLLPDPRFADPVTWQEPFSIKQPLDAHATQSLQNILRVGYPTEVATEPIQQTAARLAQVRWPTLFLLVVALLASVGDWSVGSDIPYQYGDSLKTIELIGELGVGSRVLVFWQNHPGVAGELDLAAAPVLASLIHTSIPLAFFSQHPLALPRVQRVLEDILDVLNKGRPEGAFPIGAPTVSTLQFWPGGPSVLPALGPTTDSTRADTEISPNLTAGPSQHRFGNLNAADFDLHIVVTDQAIDVIHWLELVTANTDVPVIAITSAGAAPLLGPYVETTQLAGLISGIGDAYHIAEPLAESAAPRLMQVLLSRSRFQSWLTLALILVALGTIVARGIARSS